MARQDLLNAGDFLDSGQATTSEETLDISGGGTDESVDTTFDPSPSDFLPDSLYFGGVDTGIPIKKKLSAFLVGKGDGMKDTWDGVQQIFGTEETKEGLRNEQRHINALYNDPRFGTTARVGQGVGFLVDPVGVLIPAARGKTLWDVTKIGLATGATFGTLGYVDEENDQSRAGNALIGAVTGGVLSPALFASARGIKGVGGKIQERASESLLNTYKKEYWKSIRHGANPSQATRNAMIKMSWTTQDKARLIVASRKPWSIEQPKRDLTSNRATGQKVGKKGKKIYNETETGKTRYDLIQADKNYQALQSKLITNTNAWCVRYRVAYCYTWCNTWCCTNTN